MNTVSEPKQEKTSNLAATCCKARPAGRASSRSHAAASMFPPMMRDERRE
jgi:hypothetical protein